MNARGAEPLCAMYHQRAERRFARRSSAARRKVTDGLLDVHVETIAPDEWKGFDSEGLLFKNMNSPEDYEEVKARLSERTFKRETLRFTQDDGAAFVVLASGRRFA